MINSLKNDSEIQVIEVYSPQRYSLLAIQAIISGMLNLLHFPVALLTFLCLLPSENNTYQITFNLLLCSGISTIIQATVGIKLPVLMSPSNLFITGIILFLKSPYWEQYSGGDLYAMGPSLRYDEFTNRTSEMRGILILSGFVFSVVCGLLWHLPITIPSETISATLISFSLTNVNQLLGETEMPLVSILLFSLSLVFYCAKNIKIPFSDKINTNGFYLNFKQFSVILSSIIIVALINNSENVNDKLLERAIASNQWYSFSLPFKDFVLPKFTIRSLVLLPVICSQFITSYCCFQALNKEKEIFLKALLLETLFIVVIAAIGVFVPLTLDPTSIGLLQMTKVKHTESSVIAGGLLVLFSIVVKMVALLSFISYPVIRGINLFLHGQLLEKGLEEMDSDETERSITVMSVLCGLVFSSAPIEIERNIFYSIVVLIIKSPVLITFIMSVAFKMLNKKIK